MQIAVKFQVRKFFYQSLLSHGVTFTQINTFKSRDLTSLPRKHLQKSELCCFDTVFRKMIRKPLSVTRLI